MGIEIPGELQWVAKYVVGAGDWPKGDETAMRRISTAWSTLATSLGTVEDDSELVVTATLQAISSGQTHDAISDTWKKVSGDEGMAGLVASAKALAKELEDGAADIEHTKYTIIAALVIFAIQMAQALATAASVIGAPAAAAEEAAAQIATRVTIRMVIKELIEKMLSREALKKVMTRAVLKELAVDGVKNAGLGVLQGAGVDLGASVLQMAERHRGGFTKNEWENLGRESLSGAAGGAVGGVLGSGGVAGKLSHDVESSLGKHAVHIASDAAGGALGSVAGTAATVPFGGKFDVDPTTLATSSLAGTGMGALGGHNDEHESASEDRDSTASDSHPGHSNSSSSHDNSPTAADNNNAATQPSSHDSEAHTRSSSYDSDASNQPSAHASDAASRSNSDPFDTSATTHDANTAGSDTTAQHENSNAHDVGDTAAHSENTQSATHDTPRTEAPTLASSSQDQPVASHSTDSPASAGQGASLNLPPHQFGGASHDVAPITTDSAQPELTQHNSPVANSAPATGLDGGTNFAGTSHDSATPESVVPESGTSNGTVDTSAFDNSTATDSDARRSTAATPEESTTTASAADTSAATSGSPTGISSMGGLGSMRGTAQAGAGHRNSTPGHTPVSETPVRTEANPLRPESSTAPTRPESSARSDAGARPGGPDRPGRRGDTPSRPGTTRGRPEELSRPEVREPSRPESARTGPSGPRAEEDPRRSQPRPAESERPSDRPEHEPTRERRDVDDHPKTTPESDRPAASGPHDRDPHTAERPTRATAPSDRPEPHRPTSEGAPRSFEPGNPRAESRPGTDGPGPERSSRPETPRPGAARPRRFEIRDDRAPESTPPPRTDPAYTPSRPGPAYHPAARHHPGGEHPASPRTYATPDRPITGYPDPNVSHLGAPVHNAPRVPYEGHREPDGYRHFATDDAGERYGENRLGQVLQHLPPELREAAVQYTKQSFPNTFLRGGNPLSDVARHFQYLHNESQGLHALSALNGGRMPRSREDLRRMQRNPYATGFQHAWINHVLHGSVDPQVRLKAVVENHNQNNFLHHYFGGMPTPEAFSRRISELDAALSHPLPEPIRAVRGLHGVSFLLTRDGQPLAGGDPRKLVGTTQTEHGYMSTSLGENPTMVDNKPFECTMKLDLPPGTHGLWMGRNSVYPDQRELVLPRETRYRITEVTHTGWTQVVHPNGGIENRPVYEIHAEVVPHSAPSPGFSPRHDVSASNAPVRPGGGNRAAASFHPVVPAARMAAPDSGARRDAAEIPTRGTYSGLEQPRVSRPVRPGEVSATRPDAPRADVPRPGATSPGRADEVRPEPARDDSDPSNHDVPQQMSQDVNPTEARPESVTEPKTDTDRIDTDSPTRPVEDPSVHRDPSESRAERPPSWLKEDSEPGSPVSDVPDRAESRSGEGQVPRDGEPEPAMPDRSVNPEPDRTSHRAEEQHDPARTADDGAVPARDVVADREHNPSGSTVDNASYRGESESDDEHVARDGAEVPDRSADSAPGRGRWSLDIDEPHWAPGERERLRATTNWSSELAEHHPASPSEPRREPETPGPHDRFGNRSDSGPRDHPDREPSDPEHVESPTAARNERASVPAEPKPSLRELFPPDGLPVDEEKLLPQFQRAIDGVYSGLRIGVYGVTGDSTRMIVRSKIYDANGIEAGEVRRFFQRSEGRLTVHHDAFYMRKHLQGQGCASEFNRAMIEWYKDSGVKEVTLVANKDVGGYAWARQGFDFAFQHEAVNKFGPRLGREFGKEKVKLEQFYLERDSLPHGTESVQLNENIEKQEDYIREIQKLRKRFHIGSPNFPTAREIADLGRPEGLLPGQSRQLSWLGKRVFMEPHTIDWRGVKSLEEKESR